MKRAREQALKERRERKQAKKDARAAEKRAVQDGDPLSETDEDENEVEDDVDGGGDGDPVAG